MRSGMKNEELTKNSVRSNSNSADFYFSVGVKISRSKLKKFIPFLSGVSSDEAITTPRFEPLSIRGVEFATMPKRPTLKPQTTILPKIEDPYNPKLLPNHKPFKEKPQQKKAPSKKNFAMKKETIVVIDKVSPRQVSPPKNKIITKVSYKEAARLPEWAMIAKPELEKIWRNLICCSNGVKPVIQGNCSFKYYVGKGNNSALIKRLMGARAWWTSTENINEANFAWTQWKDKNYIQTLPNGKTIEHSIDTYYTPQINYQVPVRINNIYRQVDLNDLGLFKIKGSPSYTAANCCEFFSLVSKVYNKLEFNQHLANKKGLFMSLKTYHDACGKNIFDCHPITYHITNGEDDPEFIKFIEAYNKQEKSKKKKKSRNVWIIKPGENSNRGHGIQVCKNLNDIKAAIKENIDIRTNQPRTYILQKYIEKPFLVQNRKFDIRCYALITCINGLMQAYFYTDGYIRTSCVEYNINDTNNNFIHLTNDAVQKHSDDYGKYEDNNKMSYKDFQRYLDYEITDKSINFYTSILPKIKAIVKDTIHAVYPKIDVNRKLNCMEIFGYDFMLDSKLKPWIIEVNTNPCLELSSSYLSYLIPTMLDNAFRIVLDTIFPSPVFNRNHDPIPENRFDLIFHQLIDGAKVMESLSQTVNEEIELSDTEETFSDKENP
ncbi:hypothetical protein SteCoe_21216 [Stentor coeruleus]|uniref:Tubulin--tyrosine ligase-like protein 9 n=1 Tax=Stentor coeruleus TaxID=5963 RepID=A0A1R2BPX4_9CILI|nr:hypothetical protein SteCoe_21216 [Stentor coeruleus]